MSTNKLSHLKEWEKIYLEVTRDISTSDDSIGLMFCWISGYTTFVNDDDTFYTLDDLKQLANDNVPKQGETVQVKFPGSDDWNDAIFVSMFKWKAVVALNAGWFIHTFIFRSKPQKTELTLAEVEKRLGLEKGSLIIKD